MIRRVVTGEREGKPAILMDGVPPDYHRFAALPGFERVQVWRTAPGAGLAVDEVARPGASLLPEPGGSVFMLVTFPPDALYSSNGFDPAAAGLEQIDKLPGIVDTFLEDKDGMHRTDTIDYCTVVEGPIWLDLDDGSLTELHTGDIIIQQATRHGWRNLGSKPATVSFVIIGI